jgi:hypothetical protein
MRTLTLRKEALADLTTEELSAVAGAGVTGLTDACVTQHCTGVMCLYTDVVCLEQ